MMQFDGEARLWHAATLCLIAGFVDAIGYFQLGHVFTANMTGNTVLLGAALVQGDWIALSYAATIGAFALGVVCAALLNVMRAPLPVHFLIAGLALAGVTVANPAQFATLCILAFAMGLQGGAISSFSGIRLPTVVVTSTLVNLIDGLVRRGINHPEHPPPPPAHLHHLAAAWLAYGVGGAAAVLTQKHLSMPLCVPAVLYAMVAIGLLRVRS